MTRFMILQVCGGVPTLGIPDTRANLMICTCHNIIIFFFSQQSTVLSSHREFPKSRIRFTFRKTVGRGIPAAATTDYSFSLPFILRISRRMSQILTVCLF